MEARSAASLSQLEAVSIKSEVPTEPSRSHRHLFDVSIPAAEPVRGDEEATKRRRRGFLFSYSDRYSRPGHSIKNHFNEAWK